MTTVYVAKPDYLNELCSELAEVTKVVGNLVFSPQHQTNVCFALDIWSDVQCVTFESISQAVKQLRMTGKFWYLNPIANIRRSHLILDELRRLPDLNRHFPVTDPIPPIGCFSLLDKNTLVFSTTRWKQWPMGQTFFIEDKKHPPNRAYLKLWEALTVIDRLPKPGDKALDLGASPGGWTYVLQSLGAHVTAVDKAPLSAPIAKLPNVHYLQQSAFALEPDSFDKAFDWVLCDVACYPDRLYPLISKWIDSGKAKNMIFTIKLQGQTDMDIIQRFKELPRSRVLHLFQNKHEATFFYPV